MAVCSISGPVFHGALYTVTGFKESERDGSQTATLQPDASSSADGAATITATNTDYMSRFNERSSWRPDEPSGYQRLLNFRMTRVHFPGVDSPSEPPSRWKSVHDGFKTTLIVLLLGFTLWAAAQEDPRAAVKDLAAFLAPAWLSSSGATPASTGAADSDGTNSEQAEL
jgi:hypothetical protein